MASQVVPTAHDWRVLVSYSGWDGKRREREIAVVTIGQQRTEAEAVELALDSLRKTLKTPKGWDWQRPPKVHDVVASPYTRERTTIQRSKYETLLARFRAKALAT